jgi:hypothetical protein
MRADASASPGRPERQANSVLNKTQADWSRIVSEILAGAKHKQAHPHEAQQSAVNEFLAHLPDGK